MVYYIYTTVQDTLHSQMCLLLLITCGLNMSIIVTLKMSRFECRPYTKLAVEISLEKFRFRPIKSIAYGVFRQKIEIRGATIVEFEYNYYEETEEENKLDYEGYNFNEDDVNFWLSILPEITGDSIVEVDAMYLSKYILRNLPSSIWKISFSNSESLSYILKWILTPNERAVRSLEIYYNGDEKMQFDVEGNLNHHISKINFQVKNVVKFMQDNPSLEHIVIDLDLDAQVSLPKTRTIIHTVYSDDASKIVFDRLNS
jgi:hypothetical protein